MTDFLHSVLAAAGSVKPPDPKPLRTVIDEFNREHPHSPSHVPEDVDLLLEQAHASVERFHARWQAHKRKLEHKKCLESGALVQRILQTSASPDVDDTHDYGLEF